MVSPDAFELCQALTEPSLIVSGEGTIVCANTAAGKLLNQSLQQLTSRRLQDISDDGDQTAASLALFSRSRSLVPASLRLGTDGDINAFRCDGRVLVHGQSASDTYLFLRLTAREPASRSFVAINQKIEELHREVSARRRTEALLSFQQAALEMVLHEVPLAEVLQLVCVAVEQQSSSGALASILLLDGRQLRHGAGPSLPPEYTAVIDGVEIGPAVGSCGTAAYCRRPVIVEDIEQDELWKDFRGAAALAGLRACWSTPILSKNGVVLGTFAMYYRQPRKPTPADWQVINVVTRTVAVAIERSESNSERRSREAALRHKDEQLSAALAASSTGTYRWNPETNEFIYFDEYLADLFGFGPEDHIAPPADFLDRIYPDDKPVVLKALLRSRTTGADLDIEYRVVLPDGSIRWLYDRGKYVVSDQCVVGACTDITARKQAEEALRDSEQQFRTMADAIPQLAWMAAADGFLYWYNKRWYEYTGTTPDQMKGWGWQAVHDPNELPRVLQKWSAAIRAGTPWEDSFPLRGKDGEYRQFLSRAFPIRDSKGDVVRWFGTNTDISEHVKAQEVLRRTEKLAAAGRLAASIAHEINNPLEAVTNLLFIAASDNEVPEHVRRYLRMADEELQRVAHIARRTLGFYKESTQPVEFSVAETLDEILRMHSRKLSEKRISIERRYRSRGDMVGSRGELRQVLANIVSNAIDAMTAPGRLLLHIGATHSAVGSEMLRVSIADQGHGIPREQLSQIFEPFFTTKRDIGTGLGLWVTKEIVDKAGGSVRVRSRTTTGRSGTVFTLLLPVGVTSQQPLGTTSAA